MKVNIEDLKIIWTPAPESEYHKVAFPKNQIYIHHTASGGNSLGDINYLNNLPGKVHTAFFIDRDGKLYQTFSSKFWAPHLGVPTSTFTKFKVKNTVEALHQKSIAIELDSYGYLEKGGFTNNKRVFVKKDANKFYAWTGEEIKAENVITYPNKFLGQMYYEKYYTPQLQSLKLLLHYLCNTFSISKDYNENMWGVSADALRGKNGIWTHISVRESGKWDCHSDPKLIEMLKNLNNEK